MIERLESSLLVGAAVGLGLYVIAAILVVLNSIVPIGFLFALIGAVSVFVFAVDLLTTRPAQQPPEDE